MTPFDEPVKADRLSARVNASGQRRYYWSAPAPAAKAGYKPLVVRVAGDDTTAAGRDQIVQEARRLNADARRWLDQRKMVAFDGTIAGLIRRYQHELGAPMTGYLTPEQATRLARGG